MTKKFPKVIIFANYNHHFDSETYMYVILAVGDNQ